VAVRGRRVFSRPISAAQKDTAAGVYALGRGTALEVQARRAPWRCWQGLALHCICSCSCACPGPVLIVKEDALMLGLGLTTRFKLWRG